MLDLVEFLGTTTLRAGWLEQEVRDRWGISMAVAWQRVNRMIDTIECEAALPLVTHRLRLVRQRQREARSGRVLTLVSRTADR